MKASRLLFVLAMAISMTSPADCGTWKDFEVETVAAGAPGFGQDGKPAVREGSGMIMGLFKNRQRELEKSEESHEVRQREREYVSAARRIVMANSPKRAGEGFHVEVIRKTGENSGFCRIVDSGTPKGSADSHAGPLYGAKKPRIFYCIGIPVECRSDGCKFRVGDLYWAGACKYDTDDGGSETIEVLSAEYELAIFFVRRNKSLHDDGDPRFSQVSKKSNGSASGKAESSPKSKKGDKPALYSFGSGFVVTKDGYLVTNYHVIEEGRLFRVRLGENVHPARYVRHDSKNDLAVLKISGKFDPLKMSPKRLEPVGREIFTMGFPQPMAQGFSPKITKGIISAHEGYKGDVRRYQIDAAIQPGNSGGPVADANGNLVGVVVSSLKASQNVNYAVKKSYLLAFLDSIPECVNNIEISDGESEIKFEDAVAKVQKSCVQIFVYK